MLLINVKMPIIVAVSFHLWGRLMTSFDDLNSNIDFEYCNIYEQFKIHA